MEQWKFGDVLRQTRERKGLGFQETAERLCIRPDLLRAIEESNVSGMPARGYARNMVTGYARFLGLNPNELGQMYLEELEVYETRKARVQARLDGEDPNVVTRSSHNDGRSITTRSPRYTNMGSSRYLDSTRSADDTGRYEPVGNRDRGERQRSNDRSRQRRDRSGQRRNGGSSQRNRTSRNEPGRSAGGRRDAGRTDAGEGTGGRSRSDGRGRESRRQRRNNPIAAFVGGIVNWVSDAVNRRRNNTFGSNWRSRDPMVNTSRYLNSPARSQTPSKLPFILVAIIILLILIIIGVLIFGGGGSKKEEEVTTLPVTSITDEVDTTTVTAPTSVTFEYTVDEGTEAWVEIYIDDSQELAETLTGETSGSYDVSGTIEFVTAVTSGVHVYVDGDEVELSTNDNGIVDYTFDFSDYLAEWNEEHGISTGTSDSSG